MLKERGDLRPLSCDFGVECGGSVGMAMPEATWTGLGRGDGFGQRASGVGGALHSLSLGSRCVGQWQRLSRPRTPPAVGCPALPSSVAFTSGGTKRCVPATETSIRLSATQGHWGT